MHKNGLYRSRDIGDILYSPVKLLFLNMITISYNLYRYEFSISYGKNAKSSGHTHCWGFGDILYSPCQAFIFISNTK